MVEMTYKGISIQADGNLHWESYISIPSRGGRRKEQNSLSWRNWHSIDCLYQQWPQRMREYLVLQTTRIEIPFRYWHIGQLGPLSIFLGIWGTSQPGKDSLCKVHGLTRGDCLWWEREVREQLCANLRTLNLKKVDMITLQQIKITELCCGPCIWRYQET